MQIEIRRTGVTNFTNAELLLLDIIATMGGTYRSFHPDVFSLQFNYPSHELDEQTLVETLRRFEASGWTCGEDFVDQWLRPDRFIRLTVEGGRLWESERRPDWSRFVMESYGRSVADTERRRVTVLGHSLSVCRAFFDVSCDCGFFDWDGGRIATAVASRQLIYWRNAQPVYLLSAWLNSRHSSTDWQHFERRRVWWRFPDEIGALWGLPPAIN